MDETIVLILFGWEIKMDVFILYFFIHLGSRIETVRVDMLTQDACLDAMARIVLDELPDMSRPIFCIGSLGDVIRYRKPD